MRMNVHGKEMVVVVVVVGEVFTRTHAHAQRAHTTHTRTSTHSLSLCNVLCSWDCAYACLTFLRLEMQRFTRVMALHTCACIFACCSSARLLERCSRAPSAAARGKTAFVVSEEWLQWTSGQKHKGVKEICTHTRTHTQTQTVA